MTVSAQTLAFEYAANGVTTTFPYGFRVLYADQVKVYVNGTLQVGGYTLTGVGDAGGGNVIFSVAPINGSTVLVRRISDRVRSTDFQQAPYFTQEELLDIDQDYQTMLLQEASADAINALRIPAVETNNVELPAAEDRANKYVGFNISGDVVALAGTGEATDAQMISFTQAGTGAVARTAQSKLREVVSVKDFGAVGDGVTDDTAAFAAALAAAKAVEIGEGSFVLNGLRMLNQRKLIGAGRNKTRLIQKLPGVPAINCLSDVSVGQLQSVEVKGFTVVGAASATVAAVFVGAFGGFAVYDSEFDYYAENTFSALEVQGNDAANVFMSKFYVYSVGTSGPAVKLNGGVYNEFDFFLVQCKTYSIDSSQASGRFKRAALEGPVRETGQMNHYFTPTVEKLPNFVGTIPNVFSDQGFQNTWDKPTFVADTPDVAKVTGAVFRTFFGTTVIDPQFLFVGTPVANPFELTNFPFVLTGPGRSSCTNKIEFTYDGSDNNRDLRLITMNGVSDSLSGYGLGYSAIQYLAPAGAFNFPIDANTDIVLWEPTTTIEFVNLSIKGSNTLKDGQVISFSSTQNITTINWPGGINASRVPATITANSSFRVVYRASNTALYRA